MTRHWVVWLAWMFWLAGSSWAQEEDYLDIERSRVGSHYGSVENASISLFPLSPGPGTVFRRAIAHAGARGLRIHFSVDSPGEQSTWKVLLFDRRGEIRWISEEGNANEPDFWSAEIPGDVVTLEVHSKSATEGVRLRVDGYLVVSEVIRPESISPDGLDQLRPIGRQRPRIRGWGRSVARLRFVGDDGSAYFCTGFLVARDLLMTNEHCIQSERERRSAQVDFDYDTPGAPLVPRLLKAILLLDRELDYGLFRLAQPTDLTPLLLREAVVQEGNPLLVIQHPAGEPKQVSLIGCAIQYTSLRGRGKSQSDFGHLCDTLGGSSGSPVLNPRDGTVIGLHHFGYKKGSTRPVNQAVKIGEILRNIERRDQAVYREILGRIPEKQRLAR
jgi:hypothetical protein